MTEIDSIRQALTVAANRQRWQRALTGLCRGLFVGAALSVLALATYKITPIPFEIVLGAAAVGAVVTAALFFHGWLQKPTLAQTARWVDSKQRLQERLSTAWELSNLPASAPVGDSWRALLLADAARFAQSFDPRKLIPLHLPGISRWALLALALCAGLGFVPEHRTKTFRESQADAQIIKDAGQQIAALTRHSLEQRPPALEQTKQALQAAEEAGVRLDQQSFTRNEALKDLANVSDKLKQQLKDIGDKNPGIKSIEKAARETASGSSANDALQKQMDALQKSLGKAAENQAALEKLGNALQKAQKGMDAMPKGDSAEAKAAREKMAQTLSDIAKQGRQLGQPMPDLEKAIAELQANQTENFQRDLGEATKDMEKMQDMAKTLQQLQEQSQNQGKDLPEQLKYGQADAAHQSLQKMMDQLHSGKMSSEEMSKMLDEVSRSISPATPYADAGKFLKEASDQLKKGDKAGASQSLAKAGDELKKVMDQMDDAKSLAASVDALNRAEEAIATRRNFGQCKGPGGKGVGTWTDDNSQLYPQQSALWDNTGVNRPDQQSRGQTDRGEAQLSDSLAPTRLHGQISAGGPMPSISLKGVSIKGQSGVGYQEAVTGAESDAQNALNQDQVPRAYQGAVRDYFDDLKK
ncbi:MAG TPA: hypothetical protein VHB20_05510 [Verrucomicrobiae bacterium]|jgi:hypothetical protein|nr:hypothetical protein [Verrucomicrobiae bacterium]